MRKLIVVAVAVLALAVSARAEELVDAAKAGDLARVERLLAADPTRVAAKDEAGYTALAWAAIRTHWDVFAALLAAGAPVDTIGADGGSPLHWACHHDRADMVALLVDRGADLTLANRWGRTPLHVAARRNCLEVAALLLRCGANPSARTREGWTPLHVAYRAGHPEMVALLLAHGADPEARDDAGAVPAASEFVRPPAIAMSREQLDAYTGRFEIEGGGEFTVWRVGDALHFMEFAPDEMVPVEPDRFLCRSEPWWVVFRRDASGGISGVDVSFLRRTVHATPRRLPNAYVGSQRCLGCHGDGAAADWLPGRHAMAYWRLATDWAKALAARTGRLAPGATPLDVPRCVGCHVVAGHDPAARFAEGFRREEGVGCEACHGPGSAYANREAMSSRERFLAAGGEIPDELTCRQCHRDERFDYAAARARLGHPTSRRRHSAAG